jgi:streptomycin 6-kinase
LSEEFRNRIIGAYGEAGTQWLHNLHGTLEEISDKWSIRLLPPYQPLSYHYVAPATNADGEPVVLKAGVPNREFSNQIDALRHFDGERVVRLLAADHDAGVMLIERLTPGRPLLDLNDDERATSIFAEVLRGMRKALPGAHEFPLISDWAKGFQRLRDRYDGGTGPFPNSALERAEGMMADLMRTMSDPVVLHGDLHHWNIVSAEREPWLALDPQGVVGEQEYDVGAWLRNPFPQIMQIADPRQLIARRVDQLVEELGFERSRVIGWAYSQNVLAAVWSLEEGTDDWKVWLAWADEIAKLL